MYTAYCAGKHKQPAGTKRQGRKGDRRSMSRVLLLLMGVAAWAGVALTAVLITFNIGERNQILMFFPILAAVVVAWGVGELVTERVFNRDEGES
jgi:high-affinity Fe2+/Pb2+ permease